MRILRAMSLIFGFALFVSPPLAAARGSSLLSGYGAPGQGQQVLLGSTLLGGPPSGSGGGGGSAGAGGSAGGGGSAPATSVGIGSGPLTPATLAATAPGGAQRASRGHGTPSLTSTGVAPASGMSAPPGTAPASTPIAGPRPATRSGSERSDVTPLPLQDSDTLLLIAGAGVLLITALGSRRLVRGR